MTQSQEVPITASALLVIDVQDSFKANRALWDQRSNPDFVGNVKQLLSAYREAGLPVYFFLHTDSDAGFEPGNPFVRLMDFITPRQDEPVLTKNTRNCFSSTSLHADLVKKGVRRLVISGIQTEQCCETTARVANDWFGYAVDFVSEATMTFPIPNHDYPGEQLGTEAIHERTEYALRRRFARIATVSDIVAEVSETTCRHVA